MVTKSVVVAAWGSRTAMSGRKGVQMGIKKLGVKMFSTLIGMLVSQVYAYVKLLKLYILNSAVFCISVIPQ